MNELQTLSNFDFTPTSLAEKRFNSPRISVIEEKELNKFLLNLITETYIKCGISYQQEDLIVNLKLFKSELSTVGYITISELQKAFRNGYKERYGKYYGLNTKTFMQWVESFIENDRNEELHKLKKTKVEMEISEEEKRNYINVTVKKCLDHYEKSTVIKDGYIIALYDIFVDDGIMSVTKEEKINAYNDAKSVIESEISLTKVQTYKQKQDINKLKKDIEKKSSGIVILRAKEILLLNFLRKMYKDEKSVIDVKEKYKV